eukprot:TRINITY_DN2894_c0_g1_i1.p1 TRINITY_DN2894_c0_g1~~TRINITY_DN2894_c0_g1_i1.p1  ORF type:complete len:553 (-),score=128.54 TRINITY_DN2894_c0_g1_i1:295-1953(-)
MPETRAPVEVAAALSECGSIASEDLYKNSAVSERSLSPKSDSSELSEVSSLEYSDSVSDGQVENFIEDFDSLKISEDAIHEGDVRHVFCPSWKLQTKFSYGKNDQITHVKTMPGQALREMTDKQKMSIEEHEKSAAVAQKEVRPPPGFENGPYTTAKTNDTDKLPILVSYADGSNTLTLTNEPLCLHNITVSSAEDSCHVFIKQMNNPTHDGLQPLEKAMLEAYNDEEAPLNLLRPIAAGSLLAVFSDGKWYRCQVVSFNQQEDTCEVKFVDHGGYTTVQVANLRQLRSDFVRLPFQALEVYLAHISSATDEIIIDIAADMLFREDISIQLVGFAEDGVPVVQAYIYVNDFIHLFTQESLDDAYKVFLDAHPEHIPMLRTATVPLQPEETCSNSKESAQTCTETESTTSEDSPASYISEFPTIAESFGESASPVSWASDSEDSGVASCLASPGIAAEHTCTAADDQQPTPIYTGDVAWMPVQQPMVAYYIPDPNTGMLMCMTAPLVAAPIVYTVQDPALLVPAPTQTIPQVEEVQQKPYEEWTQEDYEQYYN